MILERTVEYHPALNVFRVYGDGLRRECVEVAGTIVNLQRLDTIEPSARAIAGWIGDVRHGDVVRHEFVVVVGLEAA